MTDIQGFSPAYGSLGDKRPPDPASATADAARQFEAVILAEILRAAGAGEAASIFGGGIGEDQFSSFLIDEYARKIAERGGIGLAEMVIRSIPQDSGTDV